MNCVCAVQVVGVRRTQTLPVRASVLHSNLPTSTSIPHWLFLSAAVSVGSGHTGHPLPFSILCSRAVKGKGGMGRMVPRAHASCLSTLVISFPPPGSPPWMSCPGVALTCLGELMSSSELRGSCPGKRENITRIKPCWSLPAPLSLSP